MPNSGLNYNYFEDYKHFLNNYGINKMPLDGWKNLLFINKVKLRKRVSGQIPVTAVGKKFEIVEPPVHPRLDQSGRWTNQLQFILETVMQAIWEHPFSKSFQNPVNTKELNAVDYYSIIKKPMDLRTIKSRLQLHYYVSAKEAIEDFLQIFENCYMYNGKLDPIVSKANILETIFDQKIHLMPTIETDAPLENLATNSSRRSSRLLKKNLNQYPTQQELEMPTDQASFLLGFRLFTHERSDLIKSTQLGKNYGIDEEKLKSDQYEAYMRFKNKKKTKKTKTGK